MVVCPVLVLHLGLQMKGAGKGPGATGADGPGATGLGGMLAAGAVGDGGRLSTQGLDKYVTGFALLGFV